MVIEVDQFHTRGQTCSPADNSDDYNRNVIFRQIPRDVRIMKHEGHESCQHYPIDFLRILKFENLPWETNDRK